jgi:hypothetical protein
MTPEEHFNRMMEMFADAVPNPEHHPKKFSHFVTLYKHVLIVEQEQDAEIRS